MTDSLRIAVLGAGYVGRAFAIAAANCGHAVTAVRRSVSVETNAAVHWCAGDFVAGPVDGVPARLDAVVLTVAPSRTTDGYDVTYPPAAAAAVALTKSSGASTLLYTSSTGVYGGRDGEWVREDTGRHGAGAGNNALMAAEDIVLGSALPRATVLRIAGIYGPGRDPRGRLTNAAGMPQRGEYWVNLAHRDDIVAALLHALRLPELPAVLNVADGRPTRAADVARWLASSAGNDPDALVFGNDAERSRSDQRVSSELLTSTGWTPRFASFREGFTSGL